MSQSQPHFQQLKPLSIDEVFILAKLGVAYVSILQMERLISELGGKVEYTEISYSEFTEQKLKEVDERANWLIGILTALELGDSAPSTLQ